MPKRKRDSDSEEKIQRKIKKLQKKLVRRQKEKSFTPDILSEPNTGSDIEYQEQEFIVPVEGIESSMVEEVNTLEKSILEALGDTTSSEKGYGDEIHPEIVKRVEEILLSGISQNEEKEKLMKKYLIPKNVMLLDAPKLNVELNGLLSDSIKNRDKRVKDRQQLLGTALSAILIMTDNIIKNNVDKIPTIAILSDVARLLSELHYQDTVTRRKLITPNLDKNIHSSIETAKRDCYLFGEKFNENVKTATAIKRSAASILKTKSSNSQRKVPDRPNVGPRQENYRAPPCTNRSNQYKKGGGDKYQQRTTVQHQIAPQPGHPPMKYYKKPVRQS
ncbi:unnamed protein product [Parnassius mnemosyne]|uniref:Uncharacterized protein n=1 Tax=Parnassius mnemosyne TaxID=213953 RepID=A0AAV1M2Z5_9NEOP